MKKIIRLTESDLRNMIAEGVRQALNEMQINSQLNEGWFKDYFNAPFNGGWTDFFKSGKRRQREFDQNHAASMRKFQQEREKKNTARREDEEFYGRQKADRQKFDNDFRMKQIPTNHSFNVGRSNYGDDPNDWTSTTPDYKHTHSYKKGNTYTSR